MDHAMASQLAQEWFKAWNNHDLDAILSHYAEDVEFQSPFITKLLGDPSGKIVGKEALRAYFDKGLQAYPDLHFEPIQTLLGLDSIVLYYRSVNQLSAAELMVLNEQGLVIQVKAHYSS
ncbi:nuclear transport factor 2 family protein [Alkalinema pantanalense CENA528]|uniref:nuclear transport factor 2 family protein n=1 Tax=Alkalinema pantanalense TaxID=1620705 RepID=UPI003D6ECEC3